MKRHATLLYLFLGLVLTTPGTAVPGESKPDALVHRIERAQIEGDVEELLASREEILARLESEPQETDIRYMLAYVDWRLVHLPGTEEEDRDALLERAQQALERNLELEPNDVESRALLSGVLGERIGEMPIRGMVMGPQAASHLRRAADTAPDNPRVVLQQGVGALFKPAMFGGSVERAEERLRRARALFAEQPDDAPWPSWGRIDTLGWLGHALVRQGRYDEARAVYEQALALEPNAAFIIHYLLPELEAEEAE